MKNWTIGKRIASGFACVIIIAMVLGVFSYTRLYVISTYSDLITKQSIPVIELACQAQKNAKDLQSLVYKLVGSNDKEDKTRLESAISAGSAENVTTFGELDKRIKDGTGRALLDKIQTTRTESIQLRRRILDLSRQESSSAQAYAMARAEFDPVNLQYVADIDALIDFIKKDTADALNGIQSAVQGSKAGILTGLSLAIIIGLGVSFLISRSTSRILRNVSASLNEGSTQVASSARQVSAASQTLAEGSSEQAASIEETSASLEELSSMTKRNAENSQKANEVSKQTRDAADKGVADMQEMSTAMEAIKVSSDDIAKIIKTIDEIAFQTNILSLNAAVEAARAGEAGMGFAVVAEEVRNLALRSAQAAKETATKIEGAISKTAQGVSLSSKVSDALNDIAAKARQVDELAAEVASASCEQTAGITQINLAIGQMDKVTQNNAATAEESAAAAEELSAQAEIMKQSVGELLQLVGGQPDVAMAKPAADCAQRAPLPQKVATLHQNGASRSVRTLASN